MPYTRNFGMRSFENVVRVARFRAPTTALAVSNGTDEMGRILIGTAVVLDPDNPGFVRRPTAGQAPSPRCGLAVYEHIQIRGVEHSMSTPQDFEHVPPGQFVQVMRGPGTKVWFKNTEDKVLYDGSSQTGRSLVAGVGGATPSVAVGDALTVTANGTFEEGTDANAWFIVEQVAGDLVECRFTF